MKFIVDTTVLSEMRKGRRADEAFQLWSGSVDRRDIALSVITLFELQKGEMLARRRDDRLAAALRHWIEEIVLPTFADRILAVDSVVATRCAALHVPRTRPLADSLIAATALVHDLVVVSRNEIDFLPMGVPLLNPWTLTSP